MNFDFTKIFRKPKSMKVENIEISQDEIIVSKNENIEILKNIENSKAQLIEHDITLSSIKSELKMIKNDMKRIVDMHQKNQSENR